MGNKLDFGKALSDGFAHWNANIQRYAILGLMVFAPIAVLDMILLLGLPGFLVFAAPQWAMALGNAVLAGMLALAINDSRSNQVERTPGELFDALKPRLGALIATAILAAFAVGIGLVFCVIPGVIAAVFLLFSGILVVLESLDPIDAMKQSVEIVKADPLNVFLVMLVGGLVNGLVLMVGGGILGIFFVGLLNLPYWFFGGIVLFITGTITAPLTTCWTVEAYHQLTDGSQNQQPPANPPATPQG